MPNVMLQTEVDVQDKNTATNESFDIACQTESVTFISLQLSANLQPITPELVKLLGKWEKLVGPALMENCRFGETALDKLHQARFNEAKARQAKLLQGRRFEHLNNLPLQSTECEIYLRFRLIERFIGCMHDME